MSILTVPLEGKRMKWDSGLYDDKHGFVAEYGKGLLEFVPVDKSNKILDIGCGTGTLTHELAKQCQYVLGIDGSPQMIETATKQYPDLDFQVINALALPYKQEWDVIFSNAVFHWISDHDGLLGQISKSLKPSGLLICEFGAYGNIHLIEQGFSEVLEEKGYSYQSKFNFPTVDAFSELLTKNNFSIQTIYDFDRPTPLQDGEHGLYNWTSQFFQGELSRFTEAEQEEILRSLEQKVRSQLWNGEHWSADYRRLRAIAQVK